MALELSLSLANTLSSDRPGGDLLMNVRDLREWLMRNELPMRVASAGELQRFRNLRTVVRDLFAARAMASRPTARTLAAINAWSALAPRAPRLLWRAEGLVADLAGKASPADLALAAIAGDASMLAATEQRLRSCEGHGCGLFFVAEHPRRRWCNSRVCGNRMRVARHAARHRQAGIVAAGVRS
jgi:predicted RNA-binding Zn ribbon-like protein